MLSLQKELLRLGGGKEGFSAATFSPDGKHLAAVASDKVVCLWDATSGKELRRPDARGRQP